MRILKAAAVVTALLLGALARGEGEPDPGKVKIAKIDVRIDGTTDIPSVLDLLGLKEGDVYSESAAEQGLVRLADSEKFLGIRSSFDPNAATLTLSLTVVRRVGAIEVKFAAGADPNRPDTLSADVADVVGLSPGDPVYPDQIPAIRDRVLTRVKDRGYRAAQAVVSLEQMAGAPNLNVLISVELGPRTIVREMVLRGFDDRDAAELFDWLDLSSSLVPPGDAAHDRKGPVEMAYDSMRLDEAVTNWSRQAREHGFFDFQLKISESGPRSDVSLLFELSKGLRYDVKFKGNVAFWTRDLRTSVIDRPMRLGVPLNLQEAEAMIVRQYESAGFADVAVGTGSEERRGVRRITFTINEGGKFFMGRLLPMGVPDSELPKVNAAIDDWMKQYRSPTTRMPFDEKFLKSEIPSLLNRIRNMGYLDVRVLEFRPIRGPKTAYVNVELPMQLGEKYAIRSVAVSGNVSLSRKELDTDIDISPGDPVDPSKIAVVRDRLLKQYRELGFLNAKIDDDESHVLRKIPESLEVDIEFSVAQGPLIRVGSPIVEGLRATKERVVLRELREDTLQPGHIWTPSGADLLDQRLLNLGIFGSVTLEPTGGRILQRASDDGGTLEEQEKDLKIGVTQRPAGSIEFGPGYRTDKGVIGFAEFTYHDLDGWNRSIQIRLQASRKIFNELFPEQNYSITYLEPFVANERVRLRFNTQYLKADYHVYQSGQRSGESEEDTSFSVGTEIDLTKNLKWIQNLYTLTFGRTFDVDNPSQINTLYGSLKYHQGSVGSTFLYDLRDNIFNPTQGWLSSTTVSYSSPYLGSKAYDSDIFGVNFASFRQELSKFFRVGSDAVIMVWGAYTKLWSFSDLGIPINDRLTIGGPSSIRSLPENSLRFLDANVGNQQSIETRVEYRQPIFFDLGIAYFLDNGEIDATRYNASAGNYTALSTGWRTGIGVGFRYKTAVGPVSLDFAYNVDPQPSEQLVRVNFSIGSF